ncbi:MAG: Protein translocase subunit SecA [Microgenomates group bacterium GW2011_GWA1_Microgenomates_45_10]|nr:MAG: Protein translocase subunit SecA [Microgenomates group bacterium GW2011_GWA1_Microgenomates_45_10]
MFRQLLDAIDENVATSLMNAHLQPQPVIPTKNVIYSSPASSTSNSAPQASASAPQSGAPAGEKVGRNDPCPCGSGKKYKKCHGA